MGVRSPRRSGPKMFEIIEKSAKIRPHRSNDFFFGLQPLQQEGNEGRTSRDKTSIFDINNIIVNENPTTGKKVNH
jgi:hypothetical protein